MPNDQSQTTAMAAFLGRPEVRSTLDAISAACQRERELKAIREEFNHGPYAMAAEIWELRRAVNGK